MKNYKFVFGLLLSSMLGYGAQAASVTPQLDPNRAAFSPTGGGPAVVQTVNVAQLQVPVATRFAATRPATAAEMPIDNFLSYVNLRNAFHYLDGDGNPVQGLRAQTKLTQQTAVAENVTEPASEILLLAGLSALAIAIRRQSPS